MQQPIANLPVFECEEKTTRYGVTIWTFRCPECKRKHSHGPMEGHRVAHCTNGKYRDNGGYYLVAKGSSVRFTFKVSA